VTGEFAPGQRHPVEARGVVDERRVAALDDLGDDRGDRVVDIGIGLALGREERGESGLKPHPRVESVIAIGLRRRGCRRLLPRRHARLAQRLDPIADLVRRVLSPAG